MNPPSANTPLSRYDYTRTLLDEFKMGSEAPVLFDIGPGDGAFACLAEQGFRWFGFDRAAWGEVTRWDLSAPCPLSDLQADFVLLLDVLEHLPNPALALDYISHATKEEGILILTTPNPHWSGCRVNMMVRGVLSGFSEQDLHENHHVFTPWPHVVERFLNNSGFDCIRYVTLDGRTKPFQRSGKLKHPLRLFVNLVQMGMEARNPAARGMSYAIVARKVSHPLVESPYSSLEAS